MSSSDYNEVSEAEDFFFVLFKLATENANVLPGSSNISLYRNASNSYAAGLFPLLAPIITS